MGPIRHSGEDLLLPRLRVLRDMPGGEQDMERAALVGIISKKVGGNASREEGERGETLAGLKGGRPERDEEALLHWEVGR